MDFLSDLFPGLRVQEAVYTRVEASAPWGLDFIPYYHTKFGLVLEGECQIDLKNGEAPVHLRKGECYLLPRGEAFRLRDRHGSPATPFEDALHLLDGRLLKLGGGGDTSVIVGGRFIFADDKYPPILDFLPPLVHFRVSNKELVALEATIQLLASETTSPGPGSHRMIDRLADIFFIQSLRASLLSDRNRDIGWLGAVADERLGKAIRLMHTDSGRRWTLESLAKQAGMSRAVFAGRFKEKMGISPMSYLTRCRLYRAQQLLRSPGLSIGEVAQESGYESEASFNKAFKRELGVPPGEFRKVSEET